jgi:hypothetical protein
LNDGNKSRGERHADKNNTDRRHYRGFVRNASSRRLFGALIPACPCASTRGCRTSAGSGCCGSGVPSPGSSGPVLLAGTGILKRLNKSPRRSLREGPLAISFAISVS